MLSSLFYWVDYGRGPMFHGEPTSSVMAPGVEIFGKRDGATQVLALHIRP